MQCRSMCGASKVVDDISERSFSFNMRTRDAEKEKAIRKNAFKLFFKEGFSGFSMQKLARAAQVSPATLYIYFKDKDDLIMQLYKEELHKMNEAMLEGFDAEMPFAEGLRVQWLNRARYIMANSLQAHFLEQVRYTPYHDTAMNAIDQNFLNQMRHFVRNSIQNGELADVPVEVYWSIAFSPLYQLIKFDLHGVSFPGNKKFRLTEERIFETFSLVLKALTP